MNRGRILKELDTSLSILLLEEKFLSPRAEFFIIRAQNISKKMKVN